MPSRRASCSRRRERSLTTRSWRAWRPATRRSRSKRWPTASSLAFYAPPGSALGAEPLHGGRAPAAHPFQPGPPEISGACAVCGLFEVDEDIDLNVLNFERFKWGGVRRSHLTYIWLDLQQFGEADRAQPTDADRTAFEQLLHTLAAIPADWTASKAAGKPWAGMLSNKAEREVLLDLLGVCSVLETPEHRGFMDHFVRAADRTLPPYRYVERAYPVSWWRAEYGVNRLAVERLGL
jgi:hypothetical protein